MSTAPPGVQRVVAVLNFFAEHPGQAFSFTDILKALDLGRATCHSLLGGLVDAEYLYRNVDKTYVIGPAFAAIGNIAHRQFSAMQVTQPELRALSDDVRAVATAARLDHNDVVIECRAGSGQLHSWSVATGERYPLRAPFAGAFFATAKSYEIERWLDHLSPPASAEEKQAFFASIEFTRAHGFSFGEYNAEVDYDPAAPALPFTGKKTAYPVKVCEQLDSGTSYQIAFVISPVFGAQGRVEFVLVLSGFRQAASGASVAALGEQLRAAAARISGFINGRNQPYPLPE